VTNRLKKLRFNRQHAARYALAALAGALLVLAFPKFSIAGLAWIAPGLLLFSTLGAPPRLAFRLAFTAGMVFYLGSLYWLLHIPLPFVPILGWIALSAYLALYPAAWVWICWRLAPFRKELPLCRHPWDAALKSAVLGGSWFGRTVWCVKCAAAWVGLEIILGRFLSGFPWEFLGVSQYKLLPLIQIASVTGVYGVSFLVVWFSAALVVAALALVRQPDSRGSWSRELFLPLAAALAVAAAGLVRIRAEPPARAEIKAALIQPSIPQTLIWDESENENRFRQLLQLSEEALQMKPDLLLWPEASLPSMLRHDEATAEAVRKLVEKHKVWAIIGSDDAEYRPGSQPDGKGKRPIDYFNSAFAISPEGEIAGDYRKRQLVIFGEYVPLVKWLPFLKYLSPAGEGGFTPGAAPVPFRLDSLGVDVSVLICFEDVFPHVARHYVEEGTDFLINLTNNGWFGESAAQWQHAAAAVFRAVENRVTLVRCTNNGLTCWIDASGAMHAVGFTDGRDVYRAGFKTVSIPVLAPGESRQLSFYTRRGDVFGWSCALWTALSLASVRLRRKKNEGPLA